uniref:Eukaryotic translation initiation factor 4E n=1 Tax=viral metagenome TaxID=1070528 RepID=A0A6C0LA78_9ZZZZ
MDAVSTPTPQHNLLDKWNLYYHLPHDKNWALSGYTIIMDSIDTVEKVVSLNNAINENIVKNCMLFVMRDGITPMWEDPRNRNGGCFSYKVINKAVPEVWHNLFYALCGESLCIDDKHNKHINGITISPKKNFCIIKIWLDTSSLQDPNMIIQISNLSKQGCLFKKHEPEF